MTRAPYLVPSGRFGARMGDTQMIDSMVHDGLIDAFEHIHMGITAENVAEDYGITREEQDEFAAKSQQKAERAIADGDLQGGDRPDRGAPEEGRAAAEFGFLGVVV